MKERADHKSWMKLDNAAKIYPAAKRRDWTALFRFSAELDEEVDPRLLAAAQARALKRLPGFAQRLKRGFFWYYLEHNEGAPDIQEDVANPCVRLAPRENKGFLFRVRYYRCRVSLEVYHVLADGSGGVSFFKTMLAEYLRLRYGADIPRDDEILDCDEAPRPDELEDAYLKYARRLGRSRREPNAYYLRGTPDSDDFIHITTGMLPVKEALAKAKEKQVTLSEYIVSAMIMALDNIQRSSGLPERLLKPVKICVPVDLRRFYPTHTKRNFSLFVNPGIEPKYGSYTFDEVLASVHHQMGAEVTEKALNARIATNVRSEQQPVLRVMPLFVKNLAMRYMFNRVGDRKTSTCISNLGAQRLPDAMASHISRMDLVLGPLSRNRVVCGMISYNGMLTLNFTRTIRESVLEREFFRFLVKQGLHVKIEANYRPEEEEEA